MRLKDYYRILGIGREASHQDVKKAYRRLAMRYHPDRNPASPGEAEDKFKEINEAYEVLGDERKKWQYDRLVSLQGRGRYDPIMGNVFGGGVEPVSMEEVSRRLAALSLFFSGSGCRSPWGCTRRRMGFWRQPGPGDAKE